LRFNFTEAHNLKKCRHAAGGAGIEAEKAIAHERRYLIAA
jgi:hypothetical protein